VTDEVGTKFELDWLTGPVIGYPDIDELIKWRKPLWLAGLIGFDEEDQLGYGNMSVRLANKFIITGTQTGGLRNLAKKHFTLVTDYSFKDNAVQCVGPIAASSETLTHAALYELGWSIGAVIHVHSERLWTEFMDTLPTTSALARYGTPEMAEEFRRIGNEPEFQETGIAVMAGHKDGLIGVGSTVKVAVKRITLLLT